MQLKIRSVICWLLVVIFILVQGLNALSDIDGGEINEPQLYDNLDGNWTAVWEFVNPANYSLSNIDISDGKATLHLSEVAFIEDSPAEFRNGTSENLLLLQGNKAGLGLDLRRNSYTLIADAMNNRIVEIDYDKWVWQYGSNTTSGYGLNELSKPTFALRIHGNRTLITDTDNNRVLDVGRDHQFYWQYGSNSTSGIKENELNKPSSAVPMSNGNILIADTHNNYVLEVTRNNQRVWQYGYLNMSDPKDSDLNTPRYAEELPNGNILIADTGNHRVIEVTKQTKTIVWQYGTGLPGWTTGKLDSPTFAKRSGSSTSATTLIADMNNHRVIEVGNSGTILWQYGTTDVPGNDTNMLALPTCAIPLPNSKTLITDTGNHRVIEVTRAKDIVWQYGTNCSSGYGLNYLEYPRSGVRIKKNLLVGTFLSQVLDGGQLTNWTTIKWTKNLPANTMILIFSRTGNQPNPDLGLWSDWSDEYLNSTGEDITSPLNKYIQYAARVQKVV